MPGYLDDAVSQPSLLPGSAGTPDRSGSWPPWPRRCRRWAVPTPQRAWPTWSARYRVSWRCRSALVKACIHLKRLRVRRYGKAGNVGIDWIAVGRRHRCASKGDSKNCCVAPVRQRMIHSPKKSPSPRRAAGSINEGTYATPLKRRIAGVDPEPPWAAPCP